MHLSGANKLMGGLDGSFDGHAHIFEASRQMTSVRRYTPLADAPFLLYRNILREMSLDGGILVQPSFYGTDNSFVLTALENAEKLPDLTISAVVVLQPDTAPDVVAELNQKGVIGLRLNLVGQDYYRFQLDDWIQMFEYINRVGWHLEVQLEGQRLARLLPTFLDHCDTIVLDHFGLPTEAEPLACPGLKAILKAPPGRVFVKASAPYRVFPDVDSDEAARLCIPLFQTLLDRLGPEHMLWGSDWPWTRFEDRHSFSDTLQWRKAWLSNSLHKQIA